MRHWIMLRLAKIKSLFQLNMLFKNICVPAAVLVFYSASFAYFSSQFLPAGVNTVFTSRLWKAGGILLAVVCLGTLVLARLKQKDRIAVKFSIAKVSAGDFLLLFIPLTSVVQYLVNNRALLSPADGLLVLAFFSLFSGIYLIAMPAVLGFCSSTRLLMSVGMAFVMTILNMASLSQYFSWFGRGSLRIQLVYFSSVLVISWFLSGLKNKKDLTLLITVFFAASVGVQWFSQGSGAKRTDLPRAENKLAALVQGRIPAVTPNIYLMVYDAYVANETMLGYGIDNSAQENFLSEQGFVLYPHTYSIGATTLDTMNRVLNVSNNEYGALKRAVSGDGMVQNAFSDLGYQTYGLFPNDYMFRGIGSSYDVSNPDRSIPPYTYLISSILMGEFKFDLWFDKQTHEDYLAIKHQTLESIPGPQQAFLYAHSHFPSHSQNSGMCLADENDLYKERLATANAEMRQDIQIITQKDPEAIVIVAGDHGPFLTKNCVTTAGDYTMAEISRLDIQDRFGTFLAIRWPTQAYEPYDDITVLQDVFPAVFAYLYNDPGILAAKMDPVIQNPGVTSGADVQQGVIVGGMDDGEPLFLSANP